LCGEGGRDGLDGVQSPFGDADDEVVGLVVGQCQPAAVEAIESDGRGEREPFVAVDEGVVAGDGVQQCRCPAGDDLTATGVEATTRSPVILT
jgi:hypothetical protein